MKVQLNTDKNIEGSQKLEAYVTQRLESVLKHYQAHITRVEVHLSDQNADKGGPDDIHCRLEARLEKKQPIAVLSKNETREKALNEAADKLKAALSKVLGKTSR